MKSVLLFLALVSALPAFADGFDIIKDGVTYRCEAGSVTDPGIVLDCANKAYSGPFSREESLNICAGATSLAPAECALKAYQGPFNKEQATTLCRRNGTIAHADCAIRAYQGPYSADEAVRLCRGNNIDLLNRSFDLMEASPEVQNRIQIMKWKAPVTEADL